VQKYGMTEIFVNFPALPLQGKVLMISYFNKACGGGSTCSKNTPSSDAAVYIG